MEVLGLHYNTLDYSSYGGFIYWITPNFPLNSQLSSSRPLLTSGCNQQRKSASLPFVLFIHKPMLELRCLFKVILPVQLLYRETFGRFLHRITFPKQLSLTTPVVILHCGVVALMFCMNCNWAGVSAFCSKCIRDSQSSTLIHQLAQNYTFHPVPQCVTFHWLGCYYVYAVCCGRQSLKSVPCNRPPNNLIVIY